MNKKLIAMAITATLVAPLVAQADEMEKSVTLYGRINNALDYNKLEDSSSTVDLSNISSRFGIKASADLGNGMTASGRYEFATSTTEEKTGVIDTRLGTVGLAGAFGSLTLGNQWSAFYNTVGSHLDPIYTLGGILYSLAGGPYRSSNTVKYAKSFGPVSLELDGRFNGSNEDDDIAEGLAGDGYGVGVTFNATENLLFALAFDGEDRDDDSKDIDRSGAAVKGTFGNFWASLSYQETEDNLAESETDQKQLHFGTSFGKTSVVVGYGTSDGGGNADPSALTLHVNQNLGGGLKAYYEGVDFDDDGAVDVDSQERHLVGLRIDF